MKKQITLCIGFFIFLVSCNNDDDSGTNNNTDTIIGEWILKKTTEPDYYSNEGGTITDVCDGNATTLVFSSESEVVVSSMVVNITPDKVCVGGTSNEVTTDMILLLKGTFPPPKEQFSYSRNGNTLTLTDSNGQFTYTFIKAN